MNKMVEQPNESNASPKMKSKNQTPPNPEMKPKDITSLSTKLTPKDQTPSQPYKLNNPNNQAAKNSINVGRDHFTQLKTAKNKKP